jgi:hypothetical protein
MTDPEAIPIRESDRDAMYILPLGIIPLQTQTLRRARLIKNVRLQSVVELFDHPDTGSGQLDIEGVSGEMGWPDFPVHPDLAVLRKLAELPSFDVYSLRITLRERHIEVNDVRQLRLSKKKSEELVSYMTQFTRPLIMEIYGRQDVSVQSFEDLIGLFRDPDVTKAREKLQVMASKLDVKIEDIPRFLEDYGDTFLSLSYYRQALDEIEPHVSAFLEWLEELTNSWQFRQDPNMRKVCSMIQGKLNELMAEITGRFENFDRSTMDLWSNVTAERFRRVETLIKSYHTTIGGVLCALTVKMGAWSRAFPTKNVGGPAKRAEFIMTEMRQGIENIQHIEDSAPMLAELR